MTNTIKDSLRSNFKIDYKKEVIFVINFAVFIFSTIALISYNPNDNSLFHFSNQQQKISNWGGFIGANVAALLFLLLGHAAIIFLFCLGVTLFLLFTTKTLSAIRSRLFWICTFFITATTFLSLVKNENLWKFSGGLIGSILANLVQSFAGTRGSLVILLATIWISTASFLHIPLFPFLTLGIKKLQALLSYIISLFLKTNPFNLFRKKTSDTKTSKIVPASDLSKDTTQDLMYWKALLEKSPEQAVQNPPVTENLASDTKDLPVSKFVLPNLALFTSNPVQNNIEALQKEVELGGKKLEEKLLYLGVKGSVSAINPGPVITMFEYKPEIDSKISKITAVEDDLAMALTATSIRILAPIPGKNVVGFEISNKIRHDVYFSDVVKSADFLNKKFHLPLALGVDVVGKPVIDDLTKMPHLLVGGATGSGKSVGLHTMIISLLCRLTPDEAKFILIDPKRLEFGAYADIPHLLFPVVTNAETAINTLKWIVQEMECRYIKMASIEARNINEYQAKKYATPEQEFENMPYIIVIIDELADLMMVGGKELELQIVRIAQMARAAGIHMIVATQRPSVEVVTGLIKVNFPSRIAFRVSSKIDSRTILDLPGAEKLLGRGDLLFKNSSSPDLLRAHGAYVSDSEIKNVVNYWKDQQKPTYLNLHEELKVNITQQNFEMEDEIYDQVIEFINKNDEISISLLQRYFRIGFNRSARLIEKLELDGLISPAQSGCKTRKVLR